MEVIELELSDECVERFMHSGEAEVRLKDMQVSGLYVRIGKATKTFALIKKINGSSAPIKIGQFPRLTVAEARFKAKEMLDTFDNGGDPRATAKAKKEEIRGLQHGKKTSWAIYEEFLKHKRESRKKKRLKIRSKDDYLRYWTVYFADWKEIRFKSITKDMIRERFHQIVKRSGERQATLAMQMLRSLFNFAIRKHPIAFAHNPVNVLTEEDKWPEPVKRKRRLLKAEIPKWLRLVWYYAHFGHTKETKVNAYFLLFVLFNAPREGETELLEWSHVDLHSRIMTFVEDNTKDKEERNIPITRFSEIIFNNLRLITGNRKYVFASTKSETGYVTAAHLYPSINERLKLKLSEHDIRRTTISIMEGLIGETTKKRIIGHSVKNDITADIYTVLEEDDLRSAMQRVEDHIFTLAGFDLRESDEKFLEELRAEFGPVKEVRICEIEGCTKEVTYGRICSMHKNRIRRRGDPNFIYEPPKKAKCSVEGCERLHHARGLCHSHYQGWLRYGEKATLPVVKNHPVWTEQCGQQGCFQKAVVKGLCRNHYNARRQIDQPKQQKEQHFGCLIPGCKNQHRARGYCSNHYKQFYSKRPVKPREVIKVCSVDKCGEPHVARGYCRSHYNTLYWNKKHPLKAREVIKDLTTI